MHGSWRSDACGVGLTGVVPTSRWCGDQRSDHRRVINEVLYRVRMGRQWWDLPERFGLWKTAYKRRIPKASGSPSAKASGSTLLRLFPAAAAIEGPGRRIELQMRASASRHLSPSVRTCGPGNG
ncbi:transposase [Streptomyces sp. NPDC032198]|uniref:transposase n=1 Tax=Streptomyces sp. NPDC032198 TaxID=3155127 RepID=UPI003400CD1B